MALPLTMMSGNQLSKGASGRNKFGMSMIGSALAVGYSAAKCFDIVHYGEAAVLKRMGNFERQEDWNRYYTFPPYVETFAPGIRFGMKRRGIAFSRPITDRYIRVSLLPNVDNELTTQQVRTDTGRNVRIGAAITWQVIDDEDAIYRAVKAVNSNRAVDVTPHLRALVIDRAGRQLVDTMATKPLEDMERLDARQDEFLDRCASKTSPLSLMGVNVDSVTLKSPYITESDRIGEAIETSATLHLQASREIAAATTESAQILAKAMRESGGFQHEASVAFNGIVSQAGHSSIPAQPGEPGTFQIIQGMSQ